MSRTFRRLAALVVSALALAVVLCPAAPGQIVYPQSMTLSRLGPALETSAIGAVVEANGGKPPATGEELWRALGQLDRFCQLPVSFSAVRLDSGLANPRVVLAAHANGVGRADVNRPNLAGRLFLAANMEQVLPGADPRVTSVEFISWNAARRQFDFGVIENMGGAGVPQLHFVDGGKCFACHKNRGPILGVNPWSNTTHDDILRLATANGLALSGSALPAAGPFALQPPAGKAQRQRIDGMALAAPEAADVDRAVRIGADLRLNRDVFRLMTRTPDGRKALLVLLGAVVGPGPLDATDRSVKQALDDAFDVSFPRFAADWVALRKEARPSTLADADPAGLLVASGVRQVRPNTALGILASAANRPVVSTVTVPTTRLVRVPNLRGGNGSLWAAVTTPRQQTTVSRRPSLVTPVEAMSAGLAARAAEEQQATVDLYATIGELNRYEAARSKGSHGLTSPVQPSNPRAFVKPPVKTPTRPSAVLDAVLLANTIGLSDGDRTFLAATLADAAKRVAAPRVTAATLARAVFEGPAFADVLSGGPLPDRDEFKDRFAAGLDDVLKSRYPSTNGFPIRREKYASGPKFDPTAPELAEPAAAPTTSCLRCHEVRASGRPRHFETIPALAFDPFDKPGREAWLRTADRARRQAVLARLQQRLFADGDMPPEDAPEYDRFRVRLAAAFDEVKTFLQTELDRLRR
jgi:hypothetical protein